MTIIGSIIIYGSDNMDYIDALFFASGSATQSGLNTYVRGRGREGACSDADVW
jgi:hypothetical protein